jgi:hypothetical protein
MKPFLNTLLLLIGLFVLTQVKMHTQTTLPAEACAWVTEAGVTGEQCIDVATLIKQFGPTGATGSTGPVITGGPCSAPGLTPPAIAIYAQDPSTKLCFPIITVADPNFKAMLSTPGTFWYAASQASTYSVPSFPPSAYGDWQAGTYTLHSGGATVNMSPPPPIPQPQVAQ